MAATMSRSCTPPVEGRTMADVEQLVYRCRQQVDQLFRDQSVTIIVFKVLLAFFTYGVLSS